MTKKIQFTLDFNEDVEDYLQSHHPDMQDYRILNQALDARGANRGKVPRYTYNVELLSVGEQFEAGQESFVDVGAFAQAPIIVGAGPGGLFCALRLADFGLSKIIGPNE